LFDHTSYSYWPWGQHGEESKESEEGQKRGEEVFTWPLDRLDEAASAQGFEEEKMSKDQKPPSQNKPKETPKPVRHPAHDHKIIRQDSDGRKIEKTTDWNRPPRPKDKG
jgi:hypothetical protein